jgi:ketosteroid isomerase-like protein
MILAHPIGTATMSSLKHPEHPNVAVVRAMFDAFRSGDVDAVREAIPEHLVWHFPGHRGRIAGRHEGRERILDFLGHVVTLTERTFELNLEDIVGGDDHVVALFRGRASRNGKRLDNPTCLVIRFERGEPTEIHEYVWDLHAVDEFWS